MKEPRGALSQVIIIIDGISVFHLVGCIKVIPVRRIERAVERHRTRLGVAKNETGNPFGLIRGRSRRVALSCTGGVEMVAYLTSPLSALSNLHRRILKNKVMLLAICDCEVAGANLHLLALVCDAD